MIRYLKSFLLLFVFIFTTNSLALEPIPPTDNNSPKILYYDLTDTIHGGTVEILEKIFIKAKDEDFEAILIQLDTPGGMLDATEDIVKLFLNATVPVIVYVAPSGARAGSAGTFITMAAHVAAMAPGTYIGAAHPVMMFGGDKEGKQQEIMNKKIESATSTYIETIAETRGRNKAWAKKAVLESESLTQKQALKHHVIDLVAIDTRDLLSKIDGRTIKLPNSTEKLNTAKYTLVTYKPELKLRFLNALASPTVIYLLVLAITAGIYLEVSHPGTFIPGSVAAICLVLVLFATRVLPINAFGVFLMLLALALLVTEIFVASYGLLTLAAIACFFVGSMFFFDPQKTDVRVPLSYIIGGSAALGAIAFFIMFSLVKTFQRRQFAGQEYLIGAQGTVEEPIEPGMEGKIFFNGEYWNATANEPIEKGMNVEVVKVSGLSVEVKSLK